MQQHARRAGWRTENDEICSEIEQMSSVERLQAEHYWYRSIIILGVGLHEQVAYRDSVAHYPTLCSRPAVREKP